MNSCFFSQINLLIRSFIFFLVMCIATVFFSFASLCTYIMSMRYRSAVVTAYTRFIIEALRIICKINYKVEGLENIPKNKVGIVLSKHQSTWETFYLPSLFHMPAIIVKRELLWIPFFGWGLHAVKPIAINRGNKASAMNQIITQGKKALDSGRWILIFPEGTRIPVGKVGTYRSGGARLAISTNYPVIPIAHNAGKFWRRRGFIKYPGTVHMAIGPLMQPADKKPEELTEAVKDWIENKILEWEK